MTKKQGKKAGKALDKRYRQIEVGTATAKIVARATGHHITDGYPAYVLDTESQRIFADNGTFNFAGNAGFGR